MWPAIRLAVGRATHASGALPVSSASSRVALNRAAALRYRPAHATRSFVATAGRPTPAAVRTTGRTAAGRPKPARKTATKKAKPKAKAKAKPKPKKRVRKVLTPEEKKAVEVRSLKATALLKEPPKLPDRTWLVYVVQQTKGNKVGAGNLTGSMAAIAQSFRTLAASDIQVRRPLSR